MRIDRSLAIVLRQWYLVRGSISRLLPMFVWVAVDIVVWGFITRYLNAVAVSRVDFVPSLLGAVLLWDFFNRVMTGVTMTFLEDVWSRNFLNLFATPITMTEYIGGLVISSIANTIIGLAVMLALATGFFGLSFLAYGAAVVPFLLVLFTFGIALGIVGCAIVLRLGPSAEWFVWPIPGLIAPFAGVFYPIATLPRWMQYVSAVLPPAYIFESMRAILSGRGIPRGSLQAASALAIVDLLVAGWFFGNVYRHAVKTGLIARYSAESVT